MVTSHPEKEIPPSSQIKELQYLSDVTYKGWTITNEDHRLLLEGLKGVHRPGGFFAVGEFQAIDIGLVLGSEAFVLGDKDLEAVKKNLSVLHIAESANKVNEVLPQLFRLIENTEGKEGLEDFAKKLTDSGGATAARIRLSWAQSQSELDRLQQLIRKGKVAVAQVDLTEPDSLKVVGTFFRSVGSRLEAAYLSNVISWRMSSIETKLEHRKAVQSLQEAGGYDQTLLIRSGENTNPRTLEKALQAFPLPYSELEEATEKEKAEREQHYGDDISLLPERIERVQSDSPFQYTFEFFTQSLAAYKEHTQHQK